MGHLFVFIFGVIGFGLLVRGVAGRRVGDEPRCGGCGFDLTGQPDAVLPGVRARCPECGAVLSHVGVVHGVRRMRRGRAVVGAVMLVLASAVVVPGMAGFDAGGWWLRNKPAGWLIRDLESQWRSTESIRVVTNLAPDLFSHVRDNGEFGEAWRRAADDELSDGELRRLGVLASDVLALGGPNDPWWAGRVFVDMSSMVCWADFAFLAIERGVLDASEREAFLRSTLRPSLVVRSEVGRGEPFVVEFETANALVLGGGSEWPRMHDTTFPTSRLGDPDDFEFVSATIGGQEIDFPIWRRETDEGVTESVRWRWSGTRRFRWGPWGHLVADCEPGMHDLIVRLRLRPDRSGAERFASGPFSTYEEIGLPEDGLVLEYRASVRVGDGATPVDTLTEGAEAAFSTLRVSIRRISDEYLSYRVYPPLVDVDGQSKQEMAGWTDEFAIAVRAVVLNGEEVIGSFPLTLPASRPKPWLYYGHVDLVDGVDCGALMIEDLKIEITTDLELARLQPHDRPVFVGPPVIIRPVDSIED